jgi:hypothetical protein
MFPQEGASFLRVAGIAIVVNRILLQTGRPNRTMGVMAVTANQLVFAHRMPGSLEGLCAYIFMAAITDFRLGSTFQDLAGLVHHMAIHAGHVFTFVMTAMPVQHMGITLMTFQANAVLCFQWGRAFAAKIDQANIIWIVGVVTARAMTGFAALSGEQSTSIRFLAVLGAHNLINVVFVTLFADINADIDTAGLDQSGQNIVFFSRNKRAQQQE